MKNNIALILLGFILFTQFSGAYFWLQQKKRMVKSQVKTGIAKEPEGERKVVLKFTLEESRTKLRWEHSREFEYNAQMYDIIRTKTVGDSVYYWCWWDKEETELNQKLKKLVTQGNPEGKQDKNHERTVPFLLTPCCQENVKTSARFAEVLQKISAQSFNFYTSFLIPPQKPPPRFG